MLVFRIWPFSISISPDTDISNSFHPFHLLQDVFWTDKSKFELFGSEKTLKINLNYTVVTEMLSFS